MTELAGEIADGALLNGLLSPDYTRAMVEIFAPEHKRWAARLTDSSSRTF